jgi:hypothetical protein
MALTYDIEREFAREHALPVDELLGKRTLAVVCSLQKANAAVLKRPTSSGRLLLPDYERLTRWRTLTKSQRAELSAILTDPESYWNGWPKYRRFPPRPGFAVQLKGPGDDAVLLIDLHNPGWEMFCGDERYWGFNFAGARLAALAKTVFAEYASDNSKSVWKRGTIKALESGAS